MKTNQQPFLPTDRIALMEFIHKKHLFALTHCESALAKAWLKQHNISIEKTGVGYSYGQIHLSVTKEIKEALEKIDYIKQSVCPANAGRNRYSAFGIQSIMFPLRDDVNRIVNFYAISLKKNTTAFFNKEGIYPNYPDPGTKKLFITDSIREAAILLSAVEFKKGEAVMALFDGEILPHQQRLLENLKELEEVIVKDDAQTVEDHEKRPN
jgi:DNA primase